MVWWTHIFPRTIYRTSTRFNHDIRVVEESEKPKLLVNGSRQSGVYVQKLWKQALDSFQISPSSSVKNILVFGVAGGDVIYLLRELYPSAHITGIDIDETMIEIGRKYFGLDRVKNISFQVADAQKFASKKMQRCCYDMVILDIFNGWSVPDVVFEDSFLDNLKQLLKPHGQLIINYIGEKEYKKKSDVFYEKLQKRFSQVLDKVIYLNRFFAARISP